MFGIRKRRRDRLKKQLMPIEWVRLIEKNVTIYKFVPDEQKDQLHGYIQVFLDEKKFEGCGGLVITDEIRLTIATQACIMILGGISDYYPSLVTILVYPHSYHAPVRDYEEGGIVTEGYEHRQGEAWDMGSIVLSWKDVKTGAKYTDGKNLVLHEFAHLLDSELGASENWHTVSNDPTYSEWSRTLSREHRQLVKMTERGESVLFDAYGATSLVEFFAVATESFFEQPNDLLRRHPVLYRQMKIFYAQDPASWVR
ncbi:MAG: M90 family metallopeptidase [Balneolales bacterium]